MLHDVCGEALFLFLVQMEEKRCFWNVNVVNSNTLNSPNWFVSERHLHICLHAAAAIFYRRDSKYRRGTNSA